MFLEFIIQCAFVRQRFVPILKEAHGQLRDAQGMCSIKLDLVLWHALELVAKKVFV